MQNTKHHFARSLTAEKYILALIGSLFHLSAKPFETFGKKIKIAIVKVPVSKTLIDFLSLPFIAITGASVYDLFTSGEKRLTQNIALLSVFGLPAIISLWLLVDKKMVFRDVRKVRKNERLFRLPFSSFDCLFIFSFSALSIVTGMAIIFGDKNVAQGLPYLLIGAVIMALTIVAFENPRIWFRDSFNAADAIERAKNIPKENFAAYRDGIFNYSADGFTVKLDNATLNVLWPDIAKITAYKVDQFTVDCIVIEVQLENTAFSINDQTAGHMKFMETAAERLTGFKKDWFGVVAFPAFETNLTIVYERKQQ